MIYFITCPEANAVKIGTTWGKPWVRFGTVQSGCPLELRLEAVCEGGNGLEATFHERFADLRIRGEWFRLTDEIRELMATLDKPEDRQARGWYSQARNRPAKVAA